MKSAVETLSETRVKLTVEVPFADLVDVESAAYKRIAGQVTIPGFRKGHVPNRIIDQRVGRGAVLEEIVNEAIPVMYDAAVRETAIMPVGRPEVEVTAVNDGESIAFTAEVDVRPEFDLPSFDTISVEVSDAEPTDADVDTQLDSLRTRFASLVTVERRAAIGDVLLVDISGADPQGGAVEDLSGTALSYELGTAGMLPGFDEAVAGAEIGEERTFEFTPEAGEWAGVPLTVKVVVTAVRERNLPAADDDFAQLASEFDTIDELRADILTRLVRVKKLEQGVEARSKVHDALVEAIELPVPEGVITAEVEEHFADGHGDDDHRAEVLDNARKALKSQFILDKVAETNDISVGESELSAWLVQQAPRYGMTPDAFAQALVEQNSVGMAVQEVRRAKALAFVLEKATVTDASGRTVDLSALDAEMA